MSLILVDEKMQYAVQKLNDAGIFTVDCCEGHFGEKIPNTYLSFVRKIDSCPEQFKIENGKVIRHLYKNLNSKKGFKEEQEEVINSLNKWVDKKTGSS